MTTQHTPGPWEAVEKFGVLGSVKGGVIREYVNGTSQDQLFMVCNVQDENGGREATNANARLIAAAPDLLAALIECEDMIRHCLFGCDAENATEKACAAIFKATGELE
jgi:hypothetical protein